jgi:hypothetical protein
MKKYLFYAMRGEKMCFNHVLLNALDLKAAGCEVYVVFEGQSVALPAQLEAEQNALYLKAKAQGLLAGICLACSVQLKVHDANKALGLPLLNDMNGHAGVKPYVEKGCEIIVM